MSYIGKKFPNLSVNAINEMGDIFEINILEKAKSLKKKILLFWYPKDFTFVCPTELHAFQQMLGQFEQRNTLVIGASCDSAEVHFAWLNTPKDNGGIEGVTYDLIADANRNLASLLGILNGQSEYNKELDTQMISGDNVSYRATYLIDEKGDVFHEGINHMPLGRNVNEYLRLIDAYIHVQEKGEVCPANWETGKEALTENRESVKNYLINN
jgi:peroxiredoxin (alkyl hydroperoxide reductase subunit C)